MRTSKALLTLVALVLGLVGTPADGGQADGEADQAAPIALRDSALVNSRVIRLGDLFDNTGAKAQASVAHAPEPGKKTIFDARWLYRVARAYRLDWRPTSLQDRTVVVRESVVISREEIEDRIREALVERGAEPNMKIKLSNPMMRLNVAGSADATVAVEDVAHDARSGRFTAILVAPVGDPSAQRTRVTGRTYETTEVPVLIRRMLPDEIIAKGDVKWIRVKSDRLQRDVIVDTADLLGKSPKRGLRQGVPIRQSSVRRPVLVARGSSVTLIHEVPNMRLTALGKAIENGSKGDTIRVVNTRSNSTVEGRVIGPGKVAILAAPHVSMK